MKTVVNADHRFFFTTKFYLNSKLVKGLAKAEDSPPKVSRKGRRRASVQHRLQCASFRRNEALAVSSSCSFCQLSVYTVPQFNSLF